jgi:hypothetical protein
MKKLSEFLKRNGIFQLMGIVFLFVMLAALIAVMLAPYEIPKEARTAYYVSVQGSAWWIQWFFILVVPTIVAAVTGIVTSIVIVVRQRMIQG